MNDYSAAAKVESWGLTGLGHLSNEFNEDSINILLHIDIGIGAVWLTLTFDMRDILKENTIWWKWKIICYHSHIAETKRLCGFQQENFQLNHRGLNYELSLKFIHISFPQINTYFKYNSRKYFIHVVRQKLLEDLKRNRIRNRRAS